MSAINLVRSWAMLRIPNLTRRCYCTGFSMRFWLLSISGAVLATVLNKSHCLPLPIVISTVCPKKVFQ